MEKAGCACSVGGTCSCAAGLPRAHVIEIYEAGAGSGKDASGSLIFPDMVLIDGNRMLLESGGVKIHEMNPGSGEPFLVTLTLYARRVTIGAELDGPDGEPVSQLQKS